MAQRTVEVDPKGNTAVVQFINGAKDSAHVNVAVQYTLLDEDKSDTLAKRWSLASWIQDPPKKVTLAPHETLTVKLHLAVPSKLAPGDYSAYIVATPNGINGHAAAPAVGLAVAPRGGGGVGMSINLNQGINDALKQVVEKHGVDSTNKQSARDTLNKGKSTAVQMPSRSFSVGFGVNNGAASSDNDWGKSFTRIMYHASKK